MTKEEINEGNNLFAKFLGYVNTTPLDNYFNIYQNKEGKMLETMSMSFHSDWNQLMEIVDKIESLDLSDIKIKNKETYFGASAIITINSFSCSIEIVGVYTDFIKITESKTRIEATFRLCVEFIKWYNKNK